MHTPQPEATFEQFNTPAQLFHWLTAALVIAAYLFSPGGTETRIYAPANDFDRGLHELLGLSIFVLTLLRVLWRALFPPPKGPEMPALMELGAKIGHWTIYALLVLVPVAAISGAWLEGHPLTPLALGNFQPWLGPSRLLGLWLADLHGWLGDVLIWLAGFHAVTALYHHFWRRDTVMLSMLPGGKGCRCHSAAKVRQNK